MSGSGQLPNYSPIWHRDLQRPAVCPVCERGGDIPLLLTIDSLIAPHPPIDFARCPSCGSIFQLGFAAPDYSVSEHPHVRTKFYVEQGAALDILALPPLIVRGRGSVRRYLEVGCGFGFGLDFADRALGWDSLGIDPSDIAEQGRRLLGVNIESRYLSRDDAQVLGRYDGLAALEVLEHIEKPDPFLEILQAHLAANGLLVVTTPDAGYVEFAHEKPGFLGTLTPGYHAILYSREGLELALRRAGFTETQIAVRGATLFAVAGNGAAGIDIEGAFDPGLFANYLEGRLRSVQQPSWPERIFARGALKSMGRRIGRGRTMLEVGFGYRLFKHLVNQGHYKEAEPVLRRLADAVRRRDGIDILAPHALVAALDRQWVFAEFVERLPACLPGLLFFNAMLRLNHHEDRPGALALFYAAHIAAKRFGESARGYGFEDAETVNLAHLALRHVRLVADWMSS